MREELIAELYNAVDETKEISLAIGNDVAYFDINIVPDEIHVMDAGVTICFGNSSITIITNDVKYNDVDDVYLVAGLENSVVIAC